jgi:hypothetical protein
MFGMTVVPPPQRRRRRRPRVVLIVIIGFVLLAVLVVGGIVAALVFVNHRYERDVIYEVSGTAKSVVISYQGNTDQDKSRERLDNVTLPWATGFHARFMTAKAMVGVSRKLNDPGTVTCTLKIDGQVVATQSSADGSALCVEPDR